MYCYSCKLFVILIFCHFPSVAGAMHHGFLALAWRRLKSILPPPCFCFLQLSSMPFFPFLSFSFLFFCPDLSLLCPLHLLVCFDYHFFSLFSFFFCVDLSLLLIIFVCFSPSVMEGFLFRLCFHVLT